MGGAGEGEHEVGPAEGGGNKGGAGVDRMG